MAPAKYSFHCLRKWFSLYKIESQTRLNIHLVVNEISEASLYKLNGYLMMPSEAICSTFFYGHQLFLYNTSLKFEITINVLVSSFRFI